MEELLRQAALILRGMWLHKWLGLAVAWLVGVVAGVFVFLIPDKYEATARIYVDTDSVLKPLMRGLTVQADSNQQIAMLSRTLINRPNVEKLVRMADLDLSLKSSDQRDALIDHLTKELKIRSAGRDNLYSLEYRSSEPEKARKVVQSLTTIFVESSLGDKRTDTDSARKFIDEQIKIYQQKLEEAENRLKEFKLRNIDAQVDFGKGSSNQLVDLNSQASKARLELREAEHARDAIRRQLAGEESSMASVPVGQESQVSVPEIDGRIDAQRKVLDTLLQKFTDEHPDVLGARRVIKDLEEQKRNEVIARKAAALLNPVAVTRVSRDSAYERLKVAFAEAEANVASLRTRTAEYESRYTRAVSQVKMMPQLEAEHAQLNRDYDIIKKNYDDLVQRRESASISEGMTSVAGVADFRLIDPPRTSPKPVAPNRLIFLPMALLAALGVGAVVSYAASQIRPVIFDSYGLREVAGLPFLGSVSRIASPQWLMTKRKGRNRFIAALAGLFTVYAGGIAAVYVIMARAT
jgi:polysaccharide chain length determinant protein (PEP-CTERM system associated)